MDYHKRNNLPNEGIAFVFVYFNIVAYLLQSENLLYQQIMELDIIKIVSHQKKDS